MADPFKPPVTLLVKLGSALVHAQEFMSVTGHTFDREAFKAVLADPEVATWLGAMEDQALLPLKRKPAE